jgi:NhaP-type Na+/H+ or K+/H+ antiporter
LYRYPAAGSLSPSDLGWGVLVYLEVLFARAVVMCLLFPILKRCGYGLTRAEAAVCVWGGLRGSVGLALALVVSEESAAYPDEKVGPVVLLCTGVVVVLTLTVNGTTTAALLQWLGLTRPEVSVQVAVRRARRHIREQCMAVYHEHLTGGAAQLLHYSVDP